MRSGPRKNEQEKKKKSTVVSNKKKSTCDEPHPAPNEKMQPIQWTERPTGALVAVNSLWPSNPAQSVQLDSSVLFFEFQYSPRPYPLL